MSSAGAPARLKDGLGPVAPFLPAIGIVALQLVLFPTGIGPWSLGVVTGMLTALVALGLALIYRANRILNLAQGDLGTVPTTLAVGLIGVSGVPYAVGLALGIAAAVVVGVVLELAIIRRFFRAPRLLLTVATIGISQLLTVGGLLLPRWLWGRDILTDAPIGDPFQARVVLGSVNFGGSEILAVVLAPLLLVALAVFLRGTDLGIAVRASAERVDRAGLLGIPVRRLQTLVWAVAATLSFVGVFLHASIFGFSGASTLSPQALVFALGALLVGRMDHLPAITASAVALRILDQGVAANHPSSPGRIYLVLGGVILLTLVLRRASTTRADADGVGWTSSDEVRPIPAELRDLGLVRLVRFGGPVLLFALAAVLPLVLSPSNELKAATVAVFALITLSVGVLTGWAGQVSLGQMSFVAVGGVVGAVATDTWHADLSLALLLAGAAGAIVAVVVGLPALRLPGLFLAVTTLAFALASSNYLLNRKEQTWIPRDRLDRPDLFRTFDLSSQAAMYEVVLVVVALCFLGVAGVRRSRTGRVLLAVRDNERGVAAYAVPVLRAKLLGFALSGFLAAVAGCLLVHINQAYAETPFVASESLGVFTAAVVGGLGSIPGAVLGALYLNGGTWFLEDQWRLLPSAVGVLAVLLVLPGGLGNLFYRGRDALLRRLARRRGIVVASLVADVADDSVAAAVRVAVPERPAGLDGTTVTAAESVEADR